jgi:UDP-2-acetamido-2-deoxy-ribo-hexuluronate aminotransferase
LERQLAEYTGAEHCITAASGTEALLMSLMALGIGPGDEVITTPFSFIATAEVIVLAGARPVFADVEPDTGNINADRIAERITPRTRAIIPVSLYGQCADMDAINALASQHQLAVIEDAAQSFGATYGGKRSCNLSELACTSFFPSKPLGCYGDGGAVFTCDERIAASLRAIRVHGAQERYVHTRIGVGGRMDTLQCAIVLAKLPSFDWELEQRRRVAERYAYWLKDKVPIMALREGRTSAYAQYTIVSRQREALRARLEADGIPSAVHYPLPITQQPAYCQMDKEAYCPEAVRLSRHVLSLPMGPYLSDADIDRICASVLAVEHDAMGATE